jgi:hypothetical protein
MRRARRSARSPECGADLLAVLQRPEVTRKLTAAARGGTPPPGAINGDLLVNFEPTIHKPEVKRRVGFHRGRSGGARISSLPVERAEEG